MIKSKQAGEVQEVAQGHMVRKAEQKLKCRPADSKSYPCFQYWAGILPGLSFLLSLIEIGGGWYYKFMDVHGSIASSFCQCLSPGGDKVLQITLLNLVAYL